MQARKVELAEPAIRQHRTMRAQAQAQMYGLNTYGNDSYNSFNQSLPEPIQVSQLASLFTATSQSLSCFLKAQYIHRPLSRHVDACATLDRAKCFH